MTAHVDKTVTSPKYTDSNTFDYTSDRILQVGDLNLIISCVTLGKLLNPVWNFCYSFAKMNWIK